MIYPYKCKECGTEYDHMQSINDDLPKTIECEECKGDMVHDIANNLPSAFKIPYHMKATHNEIRPSYTKMQPNEKKLY